MWGKWALSYNGREIVIGISFKKSIEPSIKIPNSFLTCTSDLPEIFFILALCEVRLGTI